MKRIPAILTLFTLAIMLLIMAQGRWHFVNYREDSFLLKPMRELQGAYIVTELEKPTCATIIDGFWQRRAERYTRDHFGFREPLIRTYNQFVWSCFHQSMNDTIVTPGRNGYLYEGYFVADHYESRMYQFADNPQQLLERFDSEASKLARLQSLLKERGTTLFVAVLPGKDYIYPENLPPRGNYTRTPGPRAYTEYCRLFNQYHVNYVDILSWFVHIKDSVSYDLMMPLGTHWSNIAATYAFDSIMRYMQSIGGPYIAPVEFWEPYEDCTRQPDKDLAELLNLLRLPHQKPCQYVDVIYPSVDSIQRKPKPKLIVIGDSFFWTVSYNYNFDNLFQYVHFWFYNNSVYFDPEHDNVSQIDLLAALTDADYVMLSYCSGQLYELGNGFIDKALQALEPDDSL